MPENFEPYNLDQAEEEAAKMREMVEQGRAADYASAERQIEARKHWQNGHLGVTAEDHRAFGGSPDLELSQNPGKTLGELWDIDKICKYLENLVASLGKARREYQEKGPNHPDIHWSRDDILSAKDSLRKAIPYLQSIAKLPEEFTEFEVEDLESDPNGSVNSAF